MGNITYHTRYYETIYEILMNMVHTRKITFPNELYECINEHGEVNDITEKTLKRVKTNKTLRNLINFTRSNKRYPTLLEYLTNPNFAIKPVTITIEDVFDYMGDSYGQYANYKNCIMYDDHDTKVLDKNLVFKPLVMHSSKEVFEEGSVIGRYIDHDYLSIVKYEDGLKMQKVPEVHVVGRDLHDGDDVKVCDAQTRRYALFYGVTITDIPPRASSVRPHLTSGNCLITTRDVETHFERNCKGHNILELDDDEIKVLESGKQNAFTDVNFKTQRMEYNDILKMKKRCIDSYRSLLKMLVKKQTSELTPKNQLSENLFKSKFEIGYEQDIINWLYDTYKNIAASHTSKKKMYEHVEKMEISPNFMDYQYDIRKYHRKLEFEKFGIDYVSFLSCERRSLALDYD
jgi:hypothetical protein